MIGFYTRQRCCTSACLCNRGCPFNLHKLIPAVAQRTGEYNRQYRATNAAGGMAFRPTYIFNLSASLMPFNQSPIPKTQIRSRLTKPAIWRQQELHRNPMPCTWHFHKVQRPTKVAPRCVQLPWPSPRSSRATTRPLVSLLTR